MGVGEEVEENQVAAALVVPDILLVILVATEVVRISMEVEEAVQ